jgi:DNA polymerase
MPVLKRDFETRSILDLKAVGATVYAEHPSTDVWCIGYAVDDGPVLIWHPGDPIPEPFFHAACTSDWLDVAHNDAFERAIEQHILGPRYGFPWVPLHRRRCTMAQALACALPGKLEKLAEILKLPFQKDAEGARLMRLMARPRKPRAGEDPNGLYWHDDPEKLARLDEYCRRDVETERALYHRLPPLSDAEQALWVLDAGINNRGFFTDGPLLEAAARIAANVDQATQDELVRITAGEVGSTNQITRLQTWLAERGCEVKDGTKGTLKAALRRKSLDPAARRAIELRLGAAHDTKVQTMIDRRSADGRIRGTLQYHGAGTGRWAARGVQVQNFVRDPGDIDAKIAAIMAGDMHAYVEPLGAIADAARGAICAAPGHRLMAGDLSGIESRGLAWIAEEPSKLAQWRKFDETGDLKDEPYGIEGTACNIPADRARGSGKTFDLAFGYQGGVVAYAAATYEGDPATKADIERYKNTWRSRHPETVRFWKLIEIAARRAVKNPGVAFPVKRISFCRHGDFLELTLPSRRIIRYPFPEIIPGKYDTDAVSFMDTANKAKGRWAPYGAYGGMWCENIVSGLARDLLSAGMQRLEAAGYPVILTVHDEIASEGPNGFGSLEEFKALFTAVPDWAEGLPIAAKVRESPRFSKPAPTKIVDEPPAKLNAEACIEDEDHPPDTTRLVWTPFDTPLPDPSCAKHYEWIAPAPQGGKYEVIPSWRRDGKPWHGQKDGKGYEFDCYSVLYGTIDFADLIEGNFEDLEKAKACAQEDADEHCQPASNTSEPDRDAPNSAPIEPDASDAGACDPSEAFAKAFFAFREELEDMQKPGAKPESHGPNGGEAPHQGNGADTSGGRADGNKPHYPHGAQRKGNVLATYFYQDHVGRNHTKVEKRIWKGEKQYPQQFWVAGGWVNKKPKGWLKIPYRLPELLAASGSDAPVFIPEGEKDVESVRELGLVATTSSEGATPLKAKVSKWAPELSRWFHGIKRVFILEDNDAPGRKFAREKAAALTGIVPDIRVVSFPDVPEGEDVTYWLQHSHSKDELLARCEAAPPWQENAGVLESVWASDVGMRAIDWLWNNRFALGKIGIIAGLPDEGKGQVLCYIAARVTCGLEWPNAEGRSPQGKVVVLSAEEDPSTNLAPRLAAAGADLSKIHLVKMVCDRDQKSGQPRKRMFSLISDLEKLCRLIIEVGDVKLVLIDPVSAYLGLGEVDSYRDTDVRAVLGPLKELAEELGIAIITVMHFNKKVDITNALLRVSNSMAFVGLPRHAYGVVADPENHRKLFVRAKNNDAADSDNQTLAYHFETREVGIDPRSGKEIRAPYIVWEEGYVDVTATEAMSAAAENKSPAQRDDAKQFLLDMLADGAEVPTAEMKDAAQAHGFSWSTVTRAKKQLKEKDGINISVTKERGVPDGRWMWKLET